jgi:hypothetical protein
MLRKKKAEEAAIAEVEKNKVKIKWFKTPEVKELQEAIDKNKIKIKKKVDIASIKCLRIDHVTLSISKEDVMYQLDDLTNNHYMNEWKQGPGRWIRKDVKNFAAGRRTFADSDYGPYMEICYASKDGFLKKALIRLILEFSTDMTEEEFKDKKKDLEDNNILNGKFNRIPYSIIKIVGANEEYAKREIISKDVEDLESLSATTDFVDYKPEESSVEENSIPLF